MNSWRILKKTLAGALAAGFVLISSTTVNAIDWYDNTNFNEYIQKHREEAAKAGYESVSGLGATTTNNEKKQVNSCEHAYVDSVLKEATCAESGTMESRCSKCGASYKTEIPATGDHSYKSEFTKEATCIEEGVTTYTCEVCGDTYEETIPMIEHDYDSRVAENATCTTDGIRVYICTVCDDSYTEVIPASGHGAQEKVVEKESGIFSKGEEVIKCADCGEVLDTFEIPSKASALLFYISNFFEYLFF